MSNLKHVKIFADGADLDGILALYKNPLIKGFTTNPTLMRKAGISDYEAFARQLLAAIPDRPISFEVFADDFDEMERAGARIASWGKNVNVKIPVTNTKGEFAGPLIARARRTRAWSVNVTAIMTLEQVERVAERLDAERRRRSSRSSPAASPTPAVDPDADHGANRCERSKPKPKAELIWASPRELLNIFQADAIGCHIITVTNDILAKLVAGRQGPRRVFARDGEDVLPATRRRRASASRAGARRPERAAVAVDSSEGICQERVSSPAAPATSAALLIPQLLERGYKVTVYDIMYFGDEFLPKSNPNLQGHPRRHPRHGEARRGDRRASTP